MNSKYYSNWKDKIRNPEPVDKTEELMAAKYQKYEDLMFNFILSILM